MLKISLAILMALLVNGCSKVAVIQKSSNSVSTLAHSSKENFEKINDAVTAEPPRLTEAEERSHQGIQEQAQIIEETQTIIEATSGVKDVTPWWANTMEIIAISIGIVGVVFGLWYLGLGVLVRKLIGYVPAAKKAEAEMLSNALDSNDPVTVREAVAVMRAKDPELNAAFKKRKSHVKQTEQST